MKYEPTLSPEERALLASSGELPDSESLPEVEKDLERLSSLLGETETPPLPQNFREDLLSEFENSRIVRPASWIPRAVGIAVAAGLAILLYLVATHSSSSPSPDKPEIAEKDTKPALEEKNSPESAVATPSLFARSAQPELWERPQELRKRLERVRNYSPLRFKKS